MKREESAARPSIEESAPEKTVKIVKSIGRLRVCGFSGMETQSGTQEGEQLDSGIGCEGRHY